MRPGQTRAHDKRRRDQQHQPSRRRQEHGFATTLHSTVDLPRYRNPGKSRRYPKFGQGECLPEGDPNRRLENSAEFKAKVAMAATGGH